MLRLSHITLIGHCWCGPRSLVSVYHRGFSIGQLQTLTKENELMNSFKQLLNNLMTDESGQDLIEYALVAALVGLGAVASMNTLSTKIGGAFNTVGNNLTSSI